MTHRSPDEIEAQLQGLLCGELTAAETTDVLGVLMEDAEAQSVLADMLALQRESRRLFDLDCGDEEIKAQLAGLYARQEVPKAASGPTSQHAVSPIVRWAVGLAAAAIVILSVGLALFAWRQTDQARRETLAIRDQLETLAGQVDAPGLTSAALAEYRALWRQVREASGGLAWALMHEDEGRFGSVSGASPDGGGMRFVRCFIVDAENGSIQSFDLLLPIRKVVDFDVPVVGHVAGRPFGIDVLSEGQWTNLEIALDDGGGRSVSLRGRARSDGQAVEVGQIRLGDRVLRIVLQVRDIDEEA